MGIWNDFVRQMMRMGTKCIYCGRELAEGETVCADCAREEEELYNPDGAAGGVFYVYRYDGVVRSLIHRFKYDDAPRCSFFMAERMAEFLGDYDINADIITFVPIHKKRKKMRGYDQSELLALHLGQLLDVPGRALLVRKRETKPQYKLSADERRKNVHDAFCLAENVDVNGKNILLIDDIITTGATAAECMKVLTNAGAYVLPLAYAKEFPQAEE